MLSSAGFYAGRTAAGRPPSLGYLFASIFIAWIFARSVTNAANLGATFGLPGAVAYASYWLSIPVAGLVIVRIRRTAGACSLAEWLTRRFGRAATLIIGSGRYAALLGVNAWGLLLASGGFMLPVLAQRCVERRAAGSVLLAE